MPVYKRQHFIEDVLLYMCKDDLFDWKACSSNKSSVQDIMQTAILKLAHHTEALYTSTEYAYILDRSVINFISNILALALNNP